MAEHNKTGKKGEEHALKYMRENNYLIRDLNWRYKKYEIDIIAEKNNCLVIVEVKTRSNEFFENPKEAVTKTKQRNLINATQAYIEEHNIDLEVRFDVIGIVQINNQVQIEHIEDAFQPSLN